MKRRPLTEQELQLIKDLGAVRIGLHSGADTETFEAYRRIHDFVWGTIPDAKGGDNGVEE